MQRQLFNDNWVLNPVDGYEIFINPENLKEEQKITLPFDAMQLEKRDASVKLGKNTGFYPSATATYVKKFDVPEEWLHKTVEIEFEGVYTHAMVYLNGQYVGGCPHGYTRFTVKLDAFLKYGTENELKVMAKNHQDSRWYSGLGIYRNVNLIVGNLCHITTNGQKVMVTTVDEFGANLQVETQLENLNHTNVSCQVVTIIRDAQNQIVSKNQAPLTIYGHEIETAKQALTIKDAQLWDDEHPYLYHIETQIFIDDTLADQTTCHYGIRTLALDAKNGLRVNGRAVKLRGACIHHDNGLIGAASISRAEERRVRLLKEAGFNAIRMAHHPVSVALLEACDKYGLYVMDELTDMWTQRKNEWDYAMDFPYHWEELCESIVTKDFNHASVIMYSIGNEIHETGSSHGAKIGRRLADKLKTLDPHRYTTNSVNLLMAAQGQVGMASAMGSGMPNPMTGIEQVEANAEAGKELDINAIMENLGPFMAMMVKSDAIGDITEETFAAVDIAGYNYAASRYEGDRDKYPNRVIVGSETMPADIANNWNLVKQFNHVIGDFTWTGWDYLGEIGIGATNYKGEPDTNVYPWYIAWCGDLDITGRRRPASYYREIVFGQRTQPYFAVKYPEFYGKEMKLGSWDFVDGFCSWTWKHHDNQPLELDIYSAGDTVEVLINNQKVAEGPVENYRTGLEVAYQPGIITIVSYQNHQEIGRFSVETASDDIALVVQAENSELEATSQELAYINIALKDSKGIVNPTLDRTVKATVTGAGVLAGLGSANPKSLEYFNAGEFQTFQGHLQAVVRPTEVGEITVVLEAEGCDPVTLSLTAN